MLQTQTKKLKLETDKKALKRLIKKIK